MEDDGPKPMKNMRPAQKHRTGAERFQADHHGEYEARARQSKDKVSRVRVHNSGYPKMQDELEKKRSVSKPSPWSPNRKHSSSVKRGGTICCICLELRNRELRHKSKYSSYKRTPEKTPKSRSGISKPKQRRRGGHSACRLYKFSKIRTNRGCQCQGPIEKKIQSNRDFAENVKMAGNNKTDINYELKYESKHQVTEMPKLKSRPGSLLDIKKEPKSDGESQKPDTSAPSVSSYNSYMSLDHEPMVE